MQHAHEPDPHQSPQSVGWRRALPWIAGIALGIVVAGVGMHLQPPATPPALLRLTAVHPGGEVVGSPIDADVVLSSDGTHIVYVAGSGGATVGRMYSRALDELEPQFEAELLPEIESGKVTISIEPRGLVLSLTESALFAPGRAQLGFEARGIMRKVGRTLARNSRPVRLEGHTDDTPIRTKKYPSNWQLATARAIAVLQFLVNESSLPVERLSAAGYGEYQPLVPNNSVQNRAKNRRVDIVVLTAENPGS